MLFCKTRMITLFAMLSVSTSVLGQQTVTTTTGGTDNTVPKFDGAASITNSTITDNGSFVSIGAAGTNTGTVLAAGNAAGFSFLKRTLTSSPATFNAGDAFAWYNPRRDGALVDVPDR